MLAATTMPSHGCEPLVKVSGWRSRLLTTCSMLLSPPNNSARRRGKTLRRKRLRTQRCTELKNLYGELML